MFAKIKNYKAFLMKLCPNIPQDYIFKALRFYQVLLKLCKKITQDSEPCVFIKFCSNFPQKFDKTIYSFAYLSNFSQIVPNNSSRL